VSKLAGSVSRVATPVKTWAPRFAFLILVAVAFALMLLGKSNAPVIERTRTAFTDMVTPMLDVMSRPVDSISEMVAGAQELVDLKAEMAELREQNDRLLQWQSAARRLEAENDSLKGLLNLTPDPELRYISARTVGDPGGTFVRSLLVNAGERDGVVRGQAAVTGAGLVGRVAEAGGRSSRVLLITDMNSRIPVLVGEDRDRAVLGGDNTSEPQLLYLGPRGVVKPGDRVVTSGHGGVFPPGIPVGLVTEVGDTGARVDPLVDWGHMEYLRILDFERPDILSSTNPAKG
jgi:rod shape-determining protein MreC